VNRRILLVRLREIGDVVFTTPAIRALRRHWPDAHLTYIVETAAAPVVRHNPHVDRLIVAPRHRGIRGLLADLTLARRLRAERYDLAIDFHGGPRASLLTWLSGARRRVGYAVAGRTWMYTTRVSRPRELRARHSVENQWDLLRAIDIPAPDRAADSVEMPIDPVAAATVAERLDRIGVAADDRIIVIHVSAGNPFRRWPLDRFVTLARELVDRDPRRRVVVTSGPSERYAVQYVINRAGALPAGEFSLPELRALVDRAALYIGGDSGPLHIAATSSTPIVGLYGPTLPERSAPWRDPRFATISVDAGSLECRPCDQRVCAPGDFRCLTMISVEQVLDAAERLLASGSQSSAATSNQR
jgi:lipopolysaccharide heptosyltransferase II